MRRALRWITFLLVALIVAGYAYYRARDPEQGPLDDAARTAAGGQYATLSDGRTHYELSGPEGGAPVVLVHGFSVPYYIWDSTKVALTQAGYRVLRYDVYGRGTSDRPDAVYGADLYDRQLGELLDAVGIVGPVHLMGLSAGGFVVGTFGGRHPERVRSVTLIDPIAGPRSSLPWSLRLPVVGPMIWQATAVPGMADGQLSDFVEPAKWPDWPDRYRPQMRYRGFGRALWSSLMALAAVDIDSVYAKLASTSLPVMLIWGEQDNTVPIELAAGVRQAIPQVQFHPIPRAGHLPHMERTDLVNPLLMAFLGPPVAPVP